MNAHGVAGGAELVATDLAYAHPGPVPAVDGVTLALGARELAFLIGPNGSGKSTLLRLLAGLAAPQRGDVTAGGVALAHAQPRERARELALLPQSLPLLPDVSVGEFVLAGRYAHVSGYGALSAADRAAVERALAQCDVTGLEARNLHELSGGQRQRVLLARALAQEARVLLVDEPTSALDPEHQIAVCELLAELARAGRTVLVVTHDLVLAAQYAQRVLVLDRGRLVADGTPEHVFTPAVLEPVYGPHLVYTQLPPRTPGEAPRPLVLPRRMSSQA